MTQNTSFKRSSDSVIQFITQKSSEQPQIERVILFGSRARGDQQDRSDYDLAVIAPQLDDSDWARWADDVRENVPSLCGIDLIRLTPQTSQALTEKIKLEGKEIYVRQ